MSPIQKIILVHTILSMKTTTLQVMNLQTSDSPVRVKTTAMVVVHEYMEMAY